MTAPTIVVALAAVRRPRPHLKKTLAELGDNVLVDLIAWSPPPESLEGVVRRLVVIGPSSSSAHLAARIIQRLRGGLKVRFWTRLRASSEALSLIHNADVVVTLDGPTLWAGWKLAQRGIPVMAGAAAAARELATRRQA